MAAPFRVAFVILRRHGAAVLVAWALLCPAPAAGEPQQPPKSLGEIAREEAERRKALKTPSKVYTKDDVPKAALLPPAAAPAGEQAPAAAGKDDHAADKAEAAATRKDSKDQKDEAYWRTRVAQAREALRRGEMFAQALQTRLNALAADFASRDDPLQRAAIADERNKAQAELDQVGRDIKAAQQQLTEIQEEARRTGVPPAWVR